MPPAPLTFSTITDWPSSLRNPSATTRAITSDDPPAPNGTTIVTGLVGQSCARAASGHAAAPPSSVLNSRRLMLTMGLPPPASLSLPRRGRQVPLGHSWNVLN